MRLTKHTHDGTPVVRPYDRPDATYNSTALWPNGYNGDLAFVYYWDDGDKLIVVPAHLNGAWFTYDGAPLDAHTVPDMEMVYA